MVVPQVPTKSDIVKIIEQLDKLLPSNFVNKQGRGRRKAYSDKSILKLSILLKLCDISYRGAKNFLEKNPKYMELLDLKNIPPFQAISRRVKVLPLHRINKDISIILSFPYVKAADELLTTFNSIPRGIACVLKSIPSQNRIGI